MGKELKVGDIVKLETANSPEIKIIDINRGNARCIWFNKDQVYHEKLFPLGVLLFFKKG